MGTGDGMRPGSERSQPNFESENKKSVPTPPINIYFGPLNLQINSRNQAAHPFAVAPKFIKINGLI
jgi:hypothetical protein